MGSDCRPVDEDETGPKTHVTARQYYAQRLHTRPEPNHFNSLHRWGRLSQVCQTLLTVVRLCIPMPLQAFSDKQVYCMQEYWIDNYVKIETQRLRWVRRNQPQIRTELYRVVRDAAAAGQTSDRVGQPVILPSTFQGGPRHMQEQYHVSSVATYCFQNWSYRERKCIVLWYFLKCFGELPTDMDYLCVVRRRAAKYTYHSFILRWLDAGWHGKSESSGQP